MSDHDALYDTPPPTGVAFTFDERGAAAFPDRYRRSVPAQPVAVRSGPDHLELCGLNVMSRAALS